MARHLALGSRMDGFGYGAGLGTGTPTPSGDGPAPLARAGLPPRFSSSPGVPPRPRRGAAGGAERGRARVAGGGHRDGQLELEVVHQFVSERFGISLSRSSCLNYLHRLGFVLKRPKKRLVKANESKREAFVAEYAALSDEARRSGAKIFFADEAHFRADADLRGKWVLKGEVALVDSSSPRYGEKASYYSAVCLETGEVEWMELEGNSNAGTSEAFLRQLRERHPGPLTVI